MTGSLTRALGLWVAAQVNGLHVVADDLANRDRHYPACTVTETGHDVQPLGCGKKDFTTRDADTGWVETAGRMHVEETAFRLVISAPSDRTRAGQEIVDGIAAAIENAVLALRIADAPLVLTDTEATPPDSYRVDSLQLAGRQPVPVDISGEPFVYRAALGLRLRRSVPVAATVENVIERIHVEG
jgi:hypothetical protein